MAEDPEPTSARDRVVDLDGLRALAHPLRIRLVDELSTYGPATASGLAERLGESSGATSYHLRQLARHGFVREVEGRGTARERWWERMPGGFSTGAPETRTTAAGREANRLIERELATMRERHLRSFIERADADLSTEWQEASTMNLINLRLTAAQLHEFSDRVSALSEELAARWRGQEVEGMRPVQIQFNAFPIMDGLSDPEASS